MSSEVTPAQVLELYMETKKEIAAIEAETKAKIDPLKKYQEARLKWLGEQMDALGLTNLKEKGVATCFFKRKEVVRVKDFDAFLAFVKENDRYDMLKKDVVKTTALEHMGDERDSPPPPGIDYTSFKEVHVQKA